ncbi:hypothetical protein ABNQ39_07035 [Azospirillum sp. A26]|uniref:hypothetical protein n=1 Tax=Azospirillum sp. A26 TaxID=3160607 RepID=UPI00366EF71E
MAETTATPTVAKSFTTSSRRFAAGQLVTEADIDGPLTFADWVRLGHIAMPAAEPDPSAAKKGGKAPAGDAAEPPAA